MCQMDPGLGFVHAISYSFCSPFLYKSDPIQFWYEMVFCVYLFWYLDLPAESWKKNADRWLFLKLFDIVPSNRKIPL